MTNERACANGKGFSRDQLQSEALVIESLLNAVIALQSVQDSEDTMVLIEMAHERSEALNRALDSVNKPRLTS